MERSLLCWHIFKSRKIYITKCVLNYVFKCILNVIWKQWECKKEVKQRHVGIQRSACRLASVTQCMCVLLDMRAQVIPLFWKSDFVRSEKCSTVLSSHASPTCWVLHRSCYQTLIKDICDLWSVCVYLVYFSVFIVYFAVISSDSDPLDHGKYTSIFESLINRKLISN